LRRLFAEGGLAPLLIVDAGSALRGAQACVRRRRAALTHPTDNRARKSPARFPGRAHFVSFNFPNSLISRIVSMVTRYRSPDAAQTVCPFPFGGDSPSMR
jgi:hypothetical protein